MSVNESNLFEENDLYIQGHCLKNSISNIKSEFEFLFKELIAGDDTSSEDLFEDLNTDDIYIKTIEEDVEQIIIENRDKIANKKKIFNLDKNRSESSEEKVRIFEILPLLFQKPNHLRSEAKILEDSIKGLELPNYTELKIKKFSDCTLFSYHFFKQFCKKEIGKENNYIFNFKDNFLNDMTKIDKEFFEDYFKYDNKKVWNSSYLNASGLNFDNRELIYEFAVYHPFKNTKTQQISVLGSCKLYDLRDKIYCVLDEIHSNTQSSFFFIENTFYNDSRLDSKVLSSKISENKIRKLNINSMCNLKESGDIINPDNKCRDESKFLYKKEIYSSGKFSPSEVYDEISMNDMTINEMHFRIGYPYLYRHIDYCDHMIMLIDVRLSDIYDRFIEENQKSLVTFQKKLKRRICDGCFFYYAKFISINDQIGGDSNKVLFFCEYCLKKVHEKELKESTLGSLKLIPYYHD